MDRQMEKNQTSINTNHPGLGPLIQGELSPDLTVIKSKAGPPTMLVKKNQKQISLHSRFDPEKEGRDLVAGLDIRPDDLLIVLGLGLGYHVKSILKNLDPQIPVVLIESSAQIFKTAFYHTDLADILDRPGLYPIIGRSQNQALRQAGRIQVKHDLARIRLLEHPASIRLDPDYYLPLARKFKNAARAGLREKLVFPRLKKEKVNILLLDSGYYLVREIEAGVRHLGHSIKRVVLPDRDFGSERALKDFLRDAAEFKPDFVLAVNHLGLDTRGVLTGLLASMNLPLASWFVDSPRLILQAEAGGHTDYCSIFLWDKDYLNEVKGLGYKNVHFLPLGTDQRLFRPPVPKPSWECKVGFVGDSMVGPVKKYIDRLGLPADYLPMVEQAARLFLEVPDQSPQRVMVRAGLISKEGLWDREKLMDLEGLVTWWATMIYRRDIMKEMACFHPTVVGDQGWRGVFEPGSFDLRPQMDYYRELPGFYPVCRVNLNITSQQMKTGLNQRVFDVPAAGAFVLTDYRRQLEDLFEPGREMVFYGDPEEARDLVRYFLKHETERQALAEKGRQRVLAEHTYGHRLNSLIKAMRQDFPA
jgi:spore maturation protein CgeB